MKPTIAKHIFKILKSSDRFLTTSNVKPLSCVYMAHVLVKLTDFHLITFEFNLYVKIKAACTLSYVFKTLMCIKPVTDTTKEVIRQANPY